MDSDGEDYERLRQKNIAEKEAFFAEFFKDIKEQVKEIKELDQSIKRKKNIENEPPKKKRKTKSNGNESFVSQVKIDSKKNYFTRSKAKVRKEQSDSNVGSSDDESSNKKGRLKVLFPWARPFQRDIDLITMGVRDDDDDEEEKEDSDNSFDEYIRRKVIYKVNKAPYDPNNIPSVDDITEEMLENIAEKSSNKTYCKYNGTSCHQCRQKTIDTKTVCRSGECIGVRGQFCGPCLRGRYGESAYKALKDPNWACPPCRGLCNCSICRTRSGLPPTGILAPTAQEEGFSSVLDYLQSTETE